jgi:hypothetical protein
MLKNQLYKFVDKHRCQDDNDDSTFLVISTTPPKTMEKIETVAERIYENDSRENVEEWLLELYDKYYGKLCNDASRITIMKTIVEEEGYTWEYPDIVEIEW